MKVVRLLRIGVRPCCVVGVLTLWACTDEDGAPPHQRAVQADRERTGLANPADTKCLEQGYRVEYVRRDGLPIGSLCVNDETGAKCRTWAWFREECSLNPRRPRGDGDHPAEKVGAPE